MGKSNALIVDTGSQEKRGPGRPKAMEFDVKTLKALHGLAKIQATVREGAAFFGVALATFEAFLDEPGVRFAWENGRENGKMSLRRKQINLAMAGNPTMLIWLGKQYLDQEDKQKTQMDVNLSVRRALLELAEGEDA